MQASQLWKLTDWCAENDVKAAALPGGRFSEEINESTAFAQNGKKR